MTNLITKNIKFPAILFLLGLLSACGGGESADGSPGDSTISTAIDATSDTGSASNDNDTNTTNPGSTGAATLSWTAPTQNVDGTTLTNLSGYKIYYGTQLGNYQNSITINNPGLTEYIIENLQGNNTYYFVITAFDSQGNESGLSNVANKVI